MTERPILFSGPMVRAILEGRKTQTRRVLNPQPEGARAIQYHGEPRWAWLGEADAFIDDVRLPYAVGDRLWVRETWSFPAINEIGGPVHVYRADGERDDVKRWRPSIHMPKWAARIWLTVTEVRVQRLQSISEEDVRAEGVTHADPDGGFARNEFAGLWNSLHGAGAWHSNPWVAAYTFEMAP